MANIRYRKDRKQWEVRRYVKDPISGKAQNLCRLVPTKTIADRIAKEFDTHAKHIRQSRYPELVSVRIAAEQFLTTWKTHSTDSFSIYEFTIQAFLKSLPPAVEYISQITPQHIMAFVSGVLEKGHKPRTANARLTAIRGFCRWFSKTYRVTNPGPEVDFLPERPPVRRFLTDDEYRKIIEDVSAQVRDRLMFLANTGLRASELCGLMWSNIAEDRKSLCVVGKGFKVRTVPLNPTCRQILDRVEQSQGGGKTPERFIFESLGTHTLDDNRLTRSGLYNTCKKIADRLELKNFGPHSFRHYFATRLITAGVPIALVSNVLGHESIKTTQQVYSHVCVQHLIGLTDILEGQANIQT
jgi:integrase/recombinase XerC